MEKFIRYVKVMEPIVKKRRDSMHVTTKAFLRDQRATLFSCWESAIFNVMSAGRGAHGKYTSNRKRGESKEDEEDRQPQKKGRPQRRTEFDFTSLMDDPRRSEDEEDDQDEDMCC